MNALKKLSALMLVSGALAIPAYAATTPAKTAAPAAAPEKHCDHHGHHHHHHRMGPPPEFLAACKDQAPGAKVSVTTPDGHKIPGTCEVMFHPDAPPPGAPDDLPPPPPPAK